jgi:glycine/D-amino acid oxidase-like deaminating enzyme
MEVDFIIVGQGLAGTLLASELIRRNKTLIVFDDPHQPSASEVAAGLINPVVFRRMTKSWMVDEAFPQMVSAIGYLEELLHTQLYYPGKMLKILNEDGIAFWQNKVFANKLEYYLDLEPVKNFRNTNIQQSFSFGSVNKSGKLDIQKLITLFAEFLNGQNSIKKEKFHFEKLSFNSQVVKYEEILARKIIFCEGSAVSMNPLFEKLKFKHSKGEILELRIPDLHLEEIISGEVFILPLGDNWYKIGATYTWDQLDLETTHSSREDLLAKLGSIISAKPAEIIQKAGIRPTMHDRKPVIGLLPENPQVGIFNGLGSKGAILGPYFALQFADFLCGSEDLIHSEVNVLRYFR